jgi:glycosyltransferase involved in cell wall biosynthesis
MPAAPTEPVLAYLLKGYPRLSETFVLNEILGLERLGFRIHIYALRNPGEAKVHADVRRIRATVDYIPDHFWRSCRALVAANLRLFADRPRVYWRSFRVAAWRSLRRRSSSTIKRFAQAGYLVERHLRREPAAHLHAHFAHGPCTTALFASELSGTPFSFTAHAKDVFVQEEAFLREKLERASFAVTCTDFNRERLAGACPTARLHCIYHGVDLGRFRARLAALPRAAARRAPPRILAVGRLVPKKGFPTLLLALGRLAGRGLACHCVIVGSGPQRRELEALVHELGIEDRVEFLGPMTQSELLAHYESADCVALACQVQEDGDRDGIPNVLVEAAAMGVPVVSTRISGIPELVVDGVTGLLVPPGDPEALADALARVLRDGGLAEALARAGRARVQELYDLGRNTARLGAIFRGALSGARTAASPPAQPLPGDRAAALGGTS